MQSPLQNFHHFINLRQGTGADRNTILVCLVVSSKPGKRQHTNTDLIKQVICSLGIRIGARMSCGVLGLGEIFWASGITVCIA